jgi:hypothetical protein
LRRRLSCMVYLKERCFKKMPAGLLTTTMNNSEIKPPAGGTGITPGLKI